MSVCFGDFCPVNTWVVDYNGPRYTCGCCNAPINLIDKTTNRVYLNESHIIVRVKCLALTLGTPIVHAVASVLNVAQRVLKLAVGFHFWAPCENEKTYSFSARAAEAGKDLLRIVCTPFAYIGLEFAALYGVIMPYDGRKLYATIERAMYESFILAPCFQPKPTSHLFGGDINKKDVF